MVKRQRLYINHYLLKRQNLQPGLSGALFTERSGVKKRERKTEIAAQKKNV